MSFSIHSPFLKTTATYICYVTETVLPVAAVCTKNSDFMAAGLVFGIFGTAFCCSRLRTPHRRHGWHNCAHLVGLGTAIASLAVSTSSAAFNILCAITIGGFGGNIVHECLAGCPEPGNEPAALQGIRAAREEPSDHPAQLELYSGQARYVETPPAA